MAPTVLTIGYGNRTFGDFLALLQAHRVRYLIDVRTHPGSKYNPDFSGHRLPSLLSDHGIQYVFMGKELGGQPEDQSCYVNGKVQYDRIEATETFQAGITRLRTANENGERVCLMCSELRPEQCHRSKLIGVGLSRAGITIGHIDETGEVITQEAAIHRLTGGQLELFETAFTSRNRYGPETAERGQ